MNRRRNAAPELVRTRFLGPDDVLAVECACPIRDGTRADGTKVLAHLHEHKCHVLVALRREKARAADPRLAALAPYADLAIATGTIVTHGGFVLAPAALVHETGSEASTCVLLRDDGTRVHVYRAPKADRGAP